MEIIMCCRECDKTVTIIVVKPDGFISIKDGKGTATINKMTDGHMTVDFYCDECSEES